MHNADSAARAQGSSPGTRPLVSDSEDFRRQAKSCRALAAQALRPQHKAFWTRLAEDWDLLAQTAANR